MALFTDGPVSGLEDLTAYDTQLLTVASVEGIDVTQKLAAAQEELKVQIEALLGDSGSAEQSHWRKEGATIANVAVTSPLRLWHTFRTLELVYEDAYSSQLNDRYKGKRNHFSERARWAYQLLRGAGIGIVGSPIPRAKEPQIVSAEGNLPDGTYYVTVAWSNSHGEEGAPSAASTITTTGSTLLVLQAPAPEGVAGWNVYVGTDPEAAARQNGLPIPIGESWLQPDTVTGTANLPGVGQSPNYVLAAPRMILRG